MKTVVLRASLAAALLAAPLAPAGAQSAVAVPIHSFRYAGPPDAALARLRKAAEDCWNGDYDSRALGPYRHVAEVPAVAPNGATVRFAWHRAAGERTGALLRRVFDVALVPETGATRVTVLIYGPHSQIGRDVEAWLVGRARCFERHRPMP